MSIPRKAAAVEQAITDRTILLVGSAPSYAHGVVDPITDLGRLALDRGLLLHVDACIGGFLLPYFRRLGAPVRDVAVHGPAQVRLHRQGRLGGALPRKGAPPAPDYLVRRDIWSARRRTGLQAGHRQRQRGVSGSEPARPRARQGGSR